MEHLLHFTIGLDRQVTGLGATLHWGPATVFFVAMSAWWVKGPALVAAAWCADLCGRRRLPLTALAAASSFFLATTSNAILKALFERARPPEVTDIHALVALPASSSFPSGHAMTAFATAGAVAVLAPRARVPILAVAALVSFSRVYLGVHFLLDVLVGSVLGLGIGLLVARLVQASCRRNEGLAAASA